MSGWDELLGIYKNADAAQAEAASAVLSDCPNDGYPLETTPRGLHCVYCGWCDGENPDGSGQ